jgi:hypothetical protein
MDPAADDPDQLAGRFRRRLDPPIKEKLDAKAIVDASFNSAIEKALRDAGPAGQ